MTEDYSMISAKMRYYQLVKLGIIKNHSTETFKDYIKNFTKENDTKI